MIQRIVLYGGIKRGTSSLTKGSYSTTTGDESTSKCSNDDTGHDTTGKTTNSGNWGTTNSGRLDVTSKIVGSVTTGDGTIVGNRADNGSLDTTFKRSALDFVTNISVVTNNRLVFARISEIGRSGVTAIDGAKIVIVAEGLVTRSENTANSRFTGIDGARVVVITRNICVNTTSGQLILRIGHNALFDSTFVVIVTDIFLWFVEDITSLWVAVVSEASVGRDREVLGFTTFFRITPVFFALVVLSTIRVGNWDHFG